jgi:hypothetical protein
MSINAQGGIMEYRRNLRKKDVDVESFKLYEDTETGDTKIDNGKLKIKNFSVYRDGTSKGEH